MAQHINLTRHSGLRRNDSRIRAVFNYQTASRGVSPAPLGLLKAKELKGRPCGWHPLLDTKLSKVFRNGTYRTQRFFDSGQHFST